MFLNETMGARGPNFGSKEVFIERKQGNLEKAYQMACQLIQYNNKDAWNYKALAWCLIDLIKKNPKDQYIEQLKQIPKFAYDDVLEKSIKFAIKITDPLNVEINKAKELSKEGKHKDSANLYFKLLKSQPENIDLQTSFAWELYRLASESLKKTPIKIENIKRYFFEYFKLSTEKPSLLHHCFLNVALKLISNEKINKNNNIDFVKFCQQWRLENLRDEDYVPSTYQAQSGETHESQPLALSVFRAVLKNAMEQDNHQALTQLIEFIETKIKFIKNDIVWLKWDLAKSYHLIGNNKAALDMLLPILKIKSNEYWLWDFFGDIYFDEDRELAISCYCKALCLQKDINFVSKIKIKLVYYFIYHEEFERAKVELQEIIDYKKENSQKISEEIEQFCSEPWFTQVILVENNKDIYLKKSIFAEQLLYQDLPWIPAMLGNTFEHNEKVSRKLFIKIESTPSLWSPDIKSFPPTEILVPDNRINLPNKKLGLPIKIKGEWSGQKFQVHLVQPREEDNDIFPIFPAVVDHINHDKKIVHFLISEKN